jgi:hypothetical protein
MGGDFRVELLRLPASKYDKHDQQGKAAFNERNPKTTKNQQQGAMKEPKQKYDTTRRKAKRGQEKSLDTHCYWFKTHKGL